MEILFFIVFFMVIGVFVFTFVKGISEWVSNNNSPRLSVEATVVDKYSRSHHHRHNGHMHTSHSYFVTFQVESGDRMELKVSRADFGLLAAGDIGTLSFQGTRFLGFERRV